MGPDAFRKARAPSPFDWEKTATATAGATVAGHGIDQDVDQRRQQGRRRAFLDIAVDGVTAGRVEFELASDLLPVTCENFLRLCKGVDVNFTSQARMQMDATGKGKERKAGREEAHRLGYEGTVVSVGSLPLWVMDDCQSGRKKKRYVGALATLVRTSS